MKEKLYILFLFLLVAVSGKTQDFNPGSNAKNQAERKGVTVDYATGIFHYTVPLYSLKSGDYELPISLDYIGKGVKANEPCGMLSYNWLLNIGGVVTRTMRGGFTDEDGGLGYLWARYNTTPLEQDVRSVGLRRRDGESDIFTAVFNGKKVDFIIRMDKDMQIYVVPLEQTDVRIESEGTYSKITGWTITDNNGDRYIYRQGGKCMDLKYMDACSSNGIFTSEYTSEWHLTRILPYNGAPIDFHYQIDVMPLSVDDLSWTSTSNMYDDYKMTYHYGKPIKEQPFDFEQYRGEFNSAINLAKMYLERCSLQMKYDNLDSKVRNFIKYGLSNVQPLLNNYVNNNDRIVGILSNLPDMVRASKELETSLKSLSSYCKSIPNDNAAHASTFLKSAACYVEACMSEVRSVKTKEIRGGSSYKVFSPWPSMIVFPEHVVKFNYFEGTFYLYGVNLYNRNMELLSSVSIAEGVSEISFLDKDGGKTSHTKFNYYKKSDFPTWEENGDDIWGYPSAQRKNGEEYEVCEMYTCLNALKNITLTDGGKVEIEYERNSTGDETVGGVRLKSLVFSDKQEEKNDTITYNYPGAGKSVYKSFLNIARVYYLEFVDQIEYGRVQQEGHPIINTGNNGFYYPYVTETVSGKGTTAYKFLVASPSSRDNYPYWLNGLLTEKSMYDTTGKLLKKSRYTYDIYTNNENKLPQIQPSNFYLDGESLERFFYRQGTPNLTGEEFYQWNIEPRLSPMNTDKFYNLQYGWKVTLKEEVEYRNNEKNPYCQTKYCYDNPMSMHPTRVVRIGSDGIERTEVLKRTMDMVDSADSVFIMMKEANLLSPIVKSLSVIDKKMVSETVNRYQFEKEAKVGSITLVEKLTYIPDTSEIYVPTTVDTLLFAHGESNYTIEASYQYANEKKSRVLVEANERTSRKCYVYNDYGKLLLECNVAGITASDKYKDTLKTIHKTDVENVLRKMRTFSYFITEEMEEFKNGFDDEQFTHFINSQDHFFVISFAQGMLNKKIGYDLIKYYYEKIVFDDQRIFNQFKLEYERMISLYPYNEDLRKLVNAIEMLLQFDKIPFLDYLCVIFNRPEELSSGYTYFPKLIPASDIQNLGLYILDGAETASGSIMHSGGKTRFTIENISPSKLKVYDIDLTKYTDISSITIDTQGSYMALIPEGANFKATSYNADGTVYARFDQTGNVEYYIYDAAGRVIQVKDQYGNIIKTYEYNQFINQ